MSIEIKRAEAVPDAVRRVVRERIRKAIEALDGDGRKSIGDEAVHDARKRFKEVRGALRVVRGELGGKRFRRENRVFRDAGRPLSEVRDARVLVETLDELVKHYRSQLARGSFKGLRRALDARRREVRERVLNHAGLTRSIVKEVRKSSRRAADWRMAHQGWKAVAAGLGRMYRKGRDAMGVALSDRSDDAYHEWRKRTKELRVGIELLARAWPEAMRPMADAAHQLGDLLGQDHDLAVLEAVVEGEKHVGSGEERELLKPLVSRRRADLRREARKLGRKLFAESDGQFIDRVHGYWRAWR